MTYVSSVDGTEQPYRVYIPDGYDTDRQFPLVVALHGTTGNQDTFFDNPRYQAHSIKLAADRHQMLVVCPYGRGPREYRGMAEHDVFAVIAEMQRKYKIDRHRIYLIGHSMGGTGAAYLAFHHPDVFDAVVPLASAYGWPSFAVNGRHVPFWWIAGEKDKDAFLIGTRLGVDRLRAVNPLVVFDTLLGEGHYGPVQDFDRILSWLKTHRLGSAPHAFTFVVDTPLHGQAYWVRVDALRHPGVLGKVEARIEGTHIRLDTQNLSRFSILPEDELIPLDREIVVQIDGRTVYHGRTQADRELAADLVSGQWKIQPRMLKRRALTDYRFTPVGDAPAQLDMHGTEAILANWITDAMRQATGANLAIINRQFYRGQPLRAGRVDMVDILHSMGPLDWNLIVAELKGRDVVEILDDNVPDPAKDKPYVKDGPEAGRLAQVSGLHYSFDSSRSSGKRIVKTDLVLDKTYSVALEGHVAHWETLLQAGRFGKLCYRVTETPLSTALYGYAMRQRVILAYRQGRVRDVTSPNREP